jgi:hypothetical protein
MKKICKQVTYNKCPELTQDEMYQLEKKCLTLLDKNYECICEKKSRHFPVIIESISPNLDLNPDEKEYKFYLSHCGQSLGNDFGFDENNHPYLIINFDEQLSCIIYNLKKSNIKHLDMHDSGKNLCINSDNILAVIDFGIAAVSDHFLTPSFLENRKAFGYHYYVGLKKRIAKIVKEKNLLPND